MRDDILCKLFKIEYHLPYWLVEMIRHTGMWVNGELVTDINKFTYRVDEEGSGHVNYIEPKSHESYITIDGKIL